MDFAIQSFFYPNMMGGRVTHFETAKNFCCMERIKGRLGIIKKNWAKGSVNQLSVERFVRNKQKNKITNSKEIDQEGSNPLLGQYEGRPPRKKKFSFTHPNSGKLVLFSGMSKTTFYGGCPQKDPSFAIFMKSRI